MIKDSKFYPLPFLFFHWYPLPSCVSNYIHQKENSKPTKSPKFIQTSNFQNLANYWLKMECLIFSHNLTECHPSSPISLQSSNTKPCVPLNWTWQLLCIMGTSARPAERIHVIQVSPMRHISHSLLHILYTLPSISAHVVVCIYLLLQLISVNSVDKFF